MAAKKVMVGKKNNANPTPTKRTSPSLSSMVDNNTSLSVRKIENGFIVSESGYMGSGKNQKYYNKDFFSPTNPVAGVPKIKFGKR